MLLSEKEKIIYQELKSKNWTLSEAIRAAKIRASFEAFEEQGLVKFELEPEIDFFDEDYLDDPALGWSKNRIENERKTIRARIEREGYWIIVGYYRGSVEESWTSSLSIGGFIGDDWKDSWYDDNVKEETLKELNELFQQKSNELAQRATLAAVT